MCHTKGQRVDSNVRNEQEPHEQVSENEGLKRRKLVWASPREPRSTRETTSSTAAIEEAKQLSETLFDHSALHCGRIVAANGFPVLLLSIALSLCFARPRTLRDSSSGADYRIVVLPTHCTLVAWAHLGRPARIEARWTSSTCSATWWCFRGGSVLLCVVAESWGRRCFFFSGCLLCWWSLLDEVFSLDARFYLSNGRCTLCFNSGIVSDRRGDRVMQDVDKLSECGF